MNAFDLVVTVVLGSTFATIVLSKSVALVEGVLALAVLIALPFVIAWLSVWSGDGVTARQVRAHPPPAPGSVAAGGHGRGAGEAEELRAAVRTQGIGSLEDVAAVVLETDGSFTVLRQAGHGSASTLVGVANRPSGAS
jgi:uncharacterized membrane protein YcaP (DUF421 family)